MLLYNNCTILCQYIILQPRSVAVNMLAFGASATSSNLVGAINIFKHTLLKIPNPNTTKLKEILQNPKSKINSFGIYWDFGFSW